MPTLTEEESEIRESAFDIIKKWLLNSPSHGIRRISRANSLAGFIFWLITFIVFTILMCAFISTVIMKYVTHPTKINLSVKQYRNSNHFPAVTFCNLNPLRNDKFLDKKPRNKSYTDDEYRNHFIQYMDELLSHSINNKHSTLVKSFYTLDDLLIQCTYNGRLCYQNLTSFFHPNYGNCYTFDNDKHVEKIRRNDALHIWSVDDEDMEDGYKLFLELYLYQNEYIQHLDERAAFRIFIHRKRDIPILAQNSLFLAPTTFTKLIYSQRIISFSQQCRNDLTNDMKLILQSNYINYTQALCFKICEFRFLQTHCQCIDRSYMVFSQFFKQNQTTKINTNGSCIDKRQCFIHRRRFDSRKSCPECLPECELVQYTIQSSYADYPNTRSQEKVLERVEKHLKKTKYSIATSNVSTCTNNRKLTLLDDIVAVEISASPYATEILTESPMYTWADLISSIGGQTGLWIGVSLISFVEIAELFFLLLRHFIKVIYYRISNRQRVLPTTND